MLRPAKGYVMILVDEAQKVGSGTLENPEGIQDVPLSGTVLEASMEEYPFPVSSRIWFRMWAGYDITYEGKTYKMVSEKDIIAYDDQGEAPIL